MPLLHRKNKILGSSFFQGLLKKIGNWKAKKEDRDFWKKQLVFKKYDCHSMESESGLCSIVFIGNTEKIKIAKIVKTFDFIENVRVLENTDRIFDISILIQKVHFGRVRDRKNKTMKLSPEIQYRIVLQEDQK